MNNRHFYWTAVIIALAVLKILYKEIDKTPERSRFLRSPPQTRSTTSAVQMLSLGCRFFESTTILEMGCAHTIIMTAAV